MQQQLPTVNTRLSHAFTAKRGWQHRSSVSVTSPMYVNEEGDWELSPSYDQLIEERLQMADRMGRDENQRRNQRDGWTPPQEAK